MREAGERLAVRIENRTLSGRDEDNRNFAPYSPAYRKAKGHRGTGVVDLHDTDRMFADFGVVKATRTGFVLGFRTRRSEQLAALHHEGAGRLPVRAFLGVPASWIADLKRWILRHR